MREDQAEFDRAFKETAKQARISEYTDEEIAELIATEPNSTLGKMAASEQRVRESWRGPARWALFISLASAAFTAIGLGIQAGLFG